MLFAHRGHLTFNVVVCFKLVVDVIIVVLSYLLMLVAIFDYTIESNFFSSHLLHSLFVLFEIFQIIGKGLTL